MDTTAAYMTYDYVYDVRIIQSLRLYHYFTVILQAFLQSAVYTYVRIRTYVFAFPLVDMQCSHAHKKRAHTVSPGLGPSTSSITHLYLGYCRINHSNHRRVTGYRIVERPTDGMFLQDTLDTGLLKGQRPNRVQDTLDTGLLKGQRLDRVQDTPDTGLLKSQRNNRVPDTKDTGSLKDQRISRVQDTRDRYRIIKKPTG